MHKANGRLKSADKKETAVFKDRYFKCEKCGKTILFTDIEFAEEKICSCGGNLYETNPYKSKIRY